MGGKKKTENSNNTTAAKSSGVTSSTTAGSSATTTGQQQQQQKKKNSHYITEETRDYSKTYSKVEIRESPKGNIISRFLDKYNIEFGLYMLEPWERALLNTLFVMFVAFSCYNTYVFYQWIRPYEDEL